MLQCLSRGTARDSQVPKPAPDTCLMEFSFGVALGFSIFICDSTGGGTDSNVSPSFPMFPKVFREYHAKTSKPAARRQAWVWKWRNHKENLTFSAVSHRLFSFQFVSLYTAKSDILAPCSPARCFQF